MTPTQVSDFLDELNLAHVITQRANGSSHAVPVWYSYVDGTYYVFTPGTSVKVKNLARDPRMTISIASNDRPYRHVVAEGTASVTPMVEAKDAVFERATSIAARYEGGLADGRAYIENLMERFPVALLTMTPTKTREWSAGS
jgi:PPOX class probable F420-dependent enzyme